MQPIRELYRVVVRPEMHKERTRLLANHVIVNRRNLDSVFTQGLDKGCTSLSSATKSPVIAALPSPVGWKLIPIAVPIAGGACPSEHATGAFRVHRDRERSEANRADRIGRQVRPNRRRYRYPPIALPNTITSPMTTA